MRAYDGLREVRVTFAHRIDAVDRELGEDVPGVVERVS